MSFFIHCFNKGNLVMLKVFHLLQICCKYIWIQLNTIVGFCVCCRNNLLWPLSSQQSLSKERHRTENVSWLFQTKLKSDVTCMYNLSCRAQQ